MPDAQRWYAQIGGGDPARGAAMLMVLPEDEQAQLLDGMYRGTSPMLTPDQMAYAHRVLGLAGALRASGQGAANAVLPAYLRNRFRGRAPETALAALRQGAADPATAPRAAAEIWRGAMPPAPQPMGQPENRGNQGAVGAQMAGLPAPGRMEEPPIGGATLPPESPSPFGGQPLPPERPTGPIMTPGPTMPAPGPTLPPGAPPAAPPISGNGGIQMPAGGYGYGSPVPFSDGWNRNGYQYYTPTSWQDYAAHGQMPTWGAPGVAEGDYASAFEQNMQQLLGRNPNYISGMHESSYANPAGGYIAPPPPPPYQTAQYQQQAPAGQPGYAQAQPYRPPAVIPGAPATALPPAAPVAPGSGTIGPANPYQSGLYGPQMQTGPAPFNGSNVYATSTPGRLLPPGLGR
jgi:hypothetical protein